MITILYIKCSFFWRVLARQYIKIYYLVNILDHSSIKTIWILGGETWKSIVCQLMNYPFEQFEDHGFKKNGLEVFF